MYFLNDLKDLKFLKIDKAKEQCFRGALFSYKAIEKHGEGAEVRNRVISNQVKPEKRIETVLPVQLCVLSTTCLYGPAFLNLPCLRVVPGFLPPTRFVSPAVAALVMGPHTPQGLNSFLQVNSLPSSCGLRQFPGRSRAATLCQISSLRL